MLSINDKEHMFELKYRPTTIEECILPAADKEVFRKLVKTKRIPHLILQSNSPGTGKTTVAKCLGNDVDAEVMFVNGSGIGIDFIKTELTAFASSMSLDGKQKIIILDEFDRQQLGEAQRYLRSFMEAYANNCSVIITANNLDGISRALKSRARVIKFGTPTPEDTLIMMREMIQRCLKICENENIQVEEPRVIAALVKKNFPDFRETVKMLDHHASKGVIDASILSQVTRDGSSISDVIDAIKTHDFAQLRKLAGKYAPDYGNFVHKLLDELYPQVSKVSKLRMYEIVGENNQMHGLAANVEIHLMLMFVQLFKEIKWEQ